MSVLRQQFEHDKRYCCVDEGKCPKERTRKLNIPTLNSFSEFMQNKIAEGKNVEFIIKEVPAFTIIMSRIISLLPTIMFMILIYLTIKMYGTGKSRTSL